MSGYPMIDALNATHPLTPREKVRKAIIDVMKPKDADITLGRIDTCTDAILAALASGSGDHAELARLAEWRDRLRADPGRAAHFGSPYADKPMQNGRTYWNIDLADDITTLLAEIAALRTSIGRHDRQVSGMLRARLAAETRATEAGRKLAEAERGAEFIARLLPSAAGLDDAPDNKVVAVYINMRELRQARTFLSKEAERG